MKHKVHDPPHTVTIRSGDKAEFAIVKAVGLTFVKLRTANETDLVASISEGTITESKCLHVYAPTDYIGWRIDNHEALSPERLKCAAGELRVNQFPSLAGTWLSPPDSGEAITEYMRRAAVEASRIHRSQARAIRYEIGFTFTVSDAPAEATSVRASESDPPADAPAKN